MHGRQPDGLLAIVPVALGLRRVHPVPAQAVRRSHRNYGRGNEGAESLAADDRAEIRPSHPGTHHADADTAVYIHVAIDVAVHIAIDVRIAVHVAAAGSHVGRAAATGPHVSRAAATAHSCVSRAAAATHSRVAAATTAAAADDDEMRAMNCG